MSLFKKSLLTNLLRFLDFKTASTITTSMVHFKLDYCNSTLIYLNLSWIVFNLFKTLLPVSLCPLSFHVTCMQTWA